MSFELEVIPEPLHRIEQVVVVVDGFQLSVSSILFLPFPNSYDLYCGI